MQYPLSLEHLIYCRVERVTSNVSTSPRLAIFDRLCRRSYACLCCLVQYLEETAGLGVLVSKVIPEKERVLAHLNWSPFR